MLCGGGCFMKVLAWSLVMKMQNISMFRIKWGWLFFAVSVCVYSQCLFSVKYKSFSLQSVSMVRVIPYSQSPCSVIPYSQSPCSVTPYSQSPCSVIPYSQSPCSVIPYSQSPCSVIPYSQSPCSVTPYSQSPCSVIPYSLHVQSFHTVSLHVLSFHTVSLHVLSFHTVSMFSHSIQSVSMCSHSIQSVSMCSHFIQFPLFKVIPNSQCQCWASFSVVGVKCRSHFSLRFIRSVGIVDMVSSRKFLEAAQNTEDNLLFYTVFKFFEQRNLRLRANPRFQPGRLI